MNFKDIILRCANGVMCFFGWCTFEPEPTARQKFKLAYGCVRGFGAREPELEKLFGAEVWQAAVNAVRDRKTFGRVALTESVRTIIDIRQYRNQRCPAAEEYATRGRFNHPLAY